jgi:zinc transport system permease protein
MTFPFQIGSFFQYDFLARALIAGLVLAITCGLLSPYVVLRRLSFSADGLSHASLGGLAVGIVLTNTDITPTTEVYIVAFLFTLMVAAAMAWIGEGRRVTSDTAIGICYVAAFAFGALLLCAKSRSSAHLEHFFFGNILAVTKADCWLLFGLMVISGGFCFSHWRWLAQWSFNEELAHASGVPVRRLRYGILMLIAVTVILSVKVVGILLVTAMLILPGAIGSLKGRSMASIQAAGLIASIVSMTVGMVVSNAANVPPGPAVVLTGVMLFLILFGRKLWRGI